MEQLTWIKNKQNGIESMRKGRRSMRIWHKCLVSVKAHKPARIRRKAKTGSMADKISEREWEMAPIVFLSNAYYNHNLHVWHFCSRLLSWIAGKERHWSQVVYMLTQYLPSVYAVCKLVQWLTGYLLACWQETSHAGDMRYVLMGQWVSEYWYIAETTWAKQVISSANNSNENL